MYSSSFLVIILLLCSILVNSRKDDQTRAVEVGEVKEVVAFNITSTVIPSRRSRSRSR